MEVASGGEDNRGERRKTMVNFGEEKRGYNKVQVDGYIKTINDEYEKLTEEYQALADELEAKKADDSYADAIASVLINAELSSRQIVTTAEYKAKEAVVKANQDVERILQTKKTVLEEIDQLSTKLLEILSEDKQIAKDECIGHVSDNVARVLNEEGSKYEQ